MARQGSGRLGWLVKATFGDIALAAGGPYSSKPRPVLVFQNQSFPTGDSTIVIPFTTSPNPRIHWRLRVRATPDNGLSKDCWLEADKVSAIRSEWVGPAVGVLEPALLEQATALAQKLMSQ